MRTEVDWPAEKTWSGEWPPGKGVSEPIRLAIGADDRLLAILARARIAVLHADHALEALRVNVTEDIPIIDLPRARFLAAGVVAGLEISDLIPATVDVGDEISLGDLL